VAIRINDDGNSTLGSATDAGIAVNSWYTVRFSVIGSTLTAYVDGRMIVSVTDPTFATGGVGLAATNANAVFDDLVVTRP
jgi:hypothetical protein